ncbi:MAG: NAD-dependent succinate-semialdehyde dehydrogenase, partial [Myxococcota bacterium]|nr:NAD-dependent succinate-semialdehyde dehydrogenase [Myxococcota bacterium]
RALPAWRALPAAVRAASLRAWADALRGAGDEVATLLTREQGKPLAEARGEVTYAASFLDWFAEEARRAYGEVIPSPQADARILVLRQPVGVCALVTPWNFPAAMITRKAGAALAAGCTVVAKPAPETPLTALALAALAERAGIPAGVLNVVTGDAATIVGAWMQSPAVRKVSFTGSTEVGRLLMRQAADTVKRISLELGGNAPFVVFPDADLEAAVDGAMASKFRNTGQTCVCANRILVHDSLHDAFAAALEKRVRALRVGPGLEVGAEQGPLINTEALAKVETHLRDAVERGARVVCGGARHALGGTFFEPTLVVDVTPEMQMTQEETFGPVAPLLRFRDEDEAVALANDTPYGLAAYVYTRDLGRAFRVSEALEAGMVAVNQGILSNEVAPFGGVKQSGLGREGAHHGLEEYLETKYLLLAGLGTP